MNDKRADWLMASYHAFQMPIEKPKQRRKMGTRSESRSRAQHQPVGSPSEVIEFILGNGGRASGDPARMPPGATVPPTAASARRTPFRFIDLFCGIGGFRLAFERAGANASSPATGTNSPARPTPPTSARNPPAISMRFPLRTSSPKWKFCGALAGKYSFAMICQERRVRLSDLARQIDSFAVVRDKLLFKGRLGKVFLEALT